jgi:methionyl-tRNA formyltransferase
VTLAYIGSSPFAATVLEALAGSRYSPALVITKPPRPKGRGQRVEITAVARSAERLGLPLLAPERLGDAAADLSALSPRVVCLCAYGALVREPILSAYEIVNVHPSLLPRWRGAAPVERALMAGDERTGVSLIRLVAELDAGPICAAAATRIEAQDDYAALAGRLAAIASRLLIEALEGPRTYVPQPDDGVTYAEKITPVDRILDPSKTAAELERIVRALHPHIGARTQGGLGVSKARVAGEEAVAAGDLVVREGRLLYGAADEPLELLRVKPPSGREMDAAAYIRGHAI